MTKFSPLFAVLVVLAAVVGSTDAFVATGSFPQCSSSLGTPSSSLDRSPASPTCLYMFEKVLGVFKKKSKKRVPPKPLVESDVELVIQVIDDYMRQHKPKEALELVRGLYMAAPELVAKNERLYELAVQGTCELADDVRMKEKVLQQGIELANGGLDGIFANDDILVKTKEEMNAKLGALSA